MSPSEGDDMGSSPVGCTIIYNMRRLLSWFFKIFQPQSTYSLNVDDIKIPNHVGIIMDGNRRWAKARSLPVIEGHRNGANNVKNIALWCTQYKVKYLTLYAFSAQNWHRDEEEVSNLQNLFLQYFNDNNLKYFAKIGTKIKFIGDLNAFKPEIRQKIDYVHQYFAEQKADLTLNIAANYGAKEEIANAASIAAQNNEPLNIDTISKYLYTSSAGDVDLLIRTGGNKRLSNFLLWQSAYAELFFCENLWPAFTQRDFNNAINFFTSQDRKFGK